MSHEALSRALKDPALLRILAEAPDLKLVSLGCDAHVRRLLNCEQYAGLLKESEGGCQICGYPASKMPQGKLYIDHQHYIERQGIAWAVRGLVCVSCNKRLGSGEPFSPSARAYLDASWYLRQCALRGVPVLGLAEPSHSHVIDHFGIAWTRDDSGIWHSTHERSRRHRWRSLLAIAGPFNLRHIAASLENEISN